MPGKGVAPSPPAANNLAALSPAKTSPFIDGPASNQVEVNFKYARQQFIIKNYAVAEYYLKKVILQSPDHPEAIKLLPWTRFFQKRYDSALISFGNTQSHFPENPASIVGTGWCYLGMQFYELAREAFNRALALAPHSFQAMKGRGFAHLALGQPELAWADFARIYSDEQVAGIRALANQWDSQGLELARHVVTHQAELDSLFAFSIEKPRYESLLYPWTGEWSHPALETAWTVYRQGIYRKALRLFQELPATAAGALDGMNGLAWASLARGNLLDAHRGFEKILRAYPKFEGALDGARAVQEALHKKSAVASYYYEIGKYRISENLFASLGKAYPHWAYPPAMLGNIAYQNDRMEEAAKQFAEAFRRDPADPTAREGMNRLETARVGLLMRAQQALRAKDPQKAAYLYWDYIKKRGPTAILDWDLAQAYKGLAWAQLDKKQYDLAIENFDRLTRFEALNPEVAKGKGLALFEAGRYAQAVPWLVQAESYFPLEDKVSAALDWTALNAFAPRRAETFYLGRLEKNPLKASSYMALGWVYYRGGNPDLGIEYFLKALSLEPELAFAAEFVKLLKKERFGWQVYNRLGWEYYQREAYDKSRRLFQAGLTRQPKSSESMKGLGYAWFRLGDLEKAESYLRRCLKRNHDPVPVQEIFSGREVNAPVTIATDATTKLGRILIKKERYKAALNVLLESFERHPDWPEINSALGWVYLNLGKLDQSRAAFNKALRFQPLYSQAHAGLKEVKRRQGSASIKKPVKKM